MANNFKYRVTSIFTHTHPVQRLLISFCLAGVVFLFIRNSHLKSLLQTVILWDTFALCMLLTSWIVIFTRNPQQIRTLASSQDGSLLYVYVLILVASFASMFPVLLLMLSSGSLGAPKLFYLPVAIGGIVFSWFMVHTTYTFHYARVFYSNDEGESKKHAAGLAFPNVIYPDYLDFAYYSFVIGMTFQVSDVETRSRKFRRITLLHSILSFGLNTFVVALTINLIASLKS